jgi:hypothetical protein
MGQHCAGYLTLGIVLVVFHYPLGVELWKPFHNRGANRRLTRSTNNFARLIATREEGECVIGG